MAGREGDSCAPSDHGIPYESMKLHTEHSRIVYNGGLDDLDLPVGAVGTVIHVHRKPLGYEVEFFNPEGETQAVVSMHPNQMRAFAGSDLAHA